MSKHSIPDSPAASEPKKIAVAVCVGCWLPASETFIYDQLQHQRATQQWVISRGTTSHAGRFPVNDRVNIGPIELLGYIHAGFAPTVTRALKRKAPDVIHAHFGLNGTIILPFAQKRKIPLVVSFHGHDVGGLEPQNKSRVRYYRYQKLAPGMFQYASKLLCASHELAELLVKYGAPEEKVAVHHLGIDIRKFMPPSDTSRRGGGEILMVGRLVEKKGLEFGINAFAQLAGRFPEARLTIIGYGPLLSALRRHCKELRVSDKVSFLGSQTPEQVRAQMAKTDIMLTPSVTTPSGDRESGVIVLKEAGAMGLPTVATQHGGIPEIIEHDVSGFLVPERDVEALVTRLSQLLADEALRTRMGQAARHIIETRYDTRTQNALLEQHLVSAAIHGK